MRKELSIANKNCYIYENGRTDDFIIQAVGGHELELLDREVEKIKDLAGNRPFTFVAFLVSDWNMELSPWKAPAVFNREAFGAGADDTLAYITEELLPAIEKDCPTDNKKRFFLGGYSLAGLFALWAAYQTTLFSGIAAVSPSVWFPKWEDFISENPIHAPRIYLSLGDKEEKTKNRMMAKVGDNIRRQYELLCKDSLVKECTLEWNPGNHFAEPELRTAKGFAWLLNGGRYNE